MADFGQRMYEIGLEGLAEQERSVAEARARGGSLLAGAGVSAGLLARVVFVGGHPDGAVEWALTSIGVAGAAAVLVAVALLWLPYELGFSLRAQDTYVRLWEMGTIEQPLVDLTLAEAFDERRRENRATVRRLAQLLVVAVAGLAAETIGLGIAAALAS